MTQNPGTRRFTAFESARFYRVRYSSCAKNVGNVCSGPRV